LDNQSIFLALEKYDFCSGMLIALAESFGFKKPIELSKAVCKTILLVM